MTQDANDRKSDQPAEVGKNIFDGVGTFLGCFCLELQSFFGQFSLDFLTAWQGVAIEEGLKLDLPLEVAQLTYGLLLQMGLGVIQDRGITGKAINQGGDHVGAADLLN